MLDCSTTVAFGGSMNTRVLLRGAPNLILSSTPVRKGPAGSSDSSTFCTAGRCPTSSAFPRSTNWVIVSGVTSTMASIHVNRSRDDSSLKLSHRIHDAETGVPSAGKVWANSSVSCRISGAGRDAVVSGSPDDDWP